MSDAQDTAGQAGRDTSAPENRRDEPTISDADRAANPFGAARREREQARHDFRGDRGRFAPKEDGKDGSKPDAQASQDGKEAVGDKPGAEGQQDQQRRSGHAPQQALDAERRKRQEATGELEGLRREVARLQGMVTGQQRPPGQQPQTEQPKPPEFFDNPDAWADHRFKGALDPVQQRLEQQLMAQRTHFSRSIAVSTHGEEAVNSALTALQGHLSANPGDAQKVESQLSQSMDPVGDVVRWHKQQNVMRTFGADPEAWIKAEVERRLSEAQGGQRNDPPPATNRQPPAQQPLPTSFAAQPSGGPRGGPGYGGPKSLSDMLPRG